MWGEGGNLLRETKEDLLLTGVFQRVRDGEIYSCLIQVLDHLHNHLLIPQYICKWETGPDDTQPLPFFIGCLISLSHFGAYSCQTL